MRQIKQYTWLQSKNLLNNRMCEGGELFYYITKT